MLLIDGYFVYLNPIPQRVKMPQGQVRKQVSEETPKCDPLCRVGVEGAAAVEGEGAGVRAPAVIHDLSTVNLPASKDRFTTHQ